MKNHLLAIVAFVFGVAGFASAEELLLKLDYRVKANRSYQTNFKRVNDGPVAVNRIRLATRGEYCNLMISKVEYLVRNHSVAQRAVYTGWSGTYDIPAGVMSSVNVHFRQTQYRHADCELLVYGVY